jgi:hypothetical protein
MYGIGPWALAFRVVHAQSAERTLNWRVNRGVGWENYEVTQRLLRL